MENPYSPPSSSVAVEPELQGEGELASLMDRFLASLVDGLIIGAITTPILFLSGAVGGTRQGVLSPFGVMLFAVGLGFTVYTVVNGYMLAKYGQSVGKRALKIRIVTLDGEQPAFLRLLLVRQLPVHLLGLLPIVGNVLGLVDALFVFRQDRRCIHDFVAGTRVVKSA